MDPPETRYAKSGTLVSSTVGDLVAGSGLRFEDRGLHALRGLPERVHLYTALPEG